METYKYIYKPKDSIDYGLAIEDNYSMSTLMKKFVVNDSKEKLYHVFSSPKDYFEYQATIPPELRTHHEVIFGFMPQRLKFDIDAPVNELQTLGDPSVVIKTVINNIIDAIIMAFYTTYGKDLFEDDFIYFKSMHVDEPKFSFHIILKKAVINSDNARIFTSYVFSMLNKNYHKFLDAGVNKSVQCFRLINCRKENSIRVKTLLTPIDIYETLITNVASCEIMPELNIIAADTQQISANSDDIETALEIAKDIVAPFRFRKESCSKLIFDRKYSSMCEICDRIHDTENTLVLYLQHDPSGIIKIYQYCRRDITNSSKYIGEFISASASGKESEPTQTPRAMKYLEKIVSGAKTTRKETLFDKLPNKNIYCERSLREFEHAHTLCVHAAMKMGKTKALFEYLSKYKDNLTPTIIRFISFRQTFSYNIKEKFPDFVLYSDVMGSLNQHKLIIQVESLHRLEIRDHPDILILDECESIFEQFDSGLLKNFNGAFATFQWLMRYSKQVVCMDAALSDRTYRILEKMRPGFVQNGLYHCNTYQNATNDNYEFTTSKSQWLMGLYTAISSDLKVVIPISSLTEAKVIYTDLKRRFKTKSIKLYSSETKMSERKEHFTDVHTYWSQYDVLIYTPTISAGVSYEKEHYDIMYGYFTDMSCPVETCIQMIGRIRNVKSNKYVMLLEGNGNTLPTDTSEITRLIYMSKENLNKLFTGAVNYEFGPNGEIKFYNTDYFTLYIENLRMRNISKNIFIRLFVETIARLGAKVGILNLSDIDNCIVNDHINIRKEIKDITSTNIATSVELSEEEYTDIMTKVNTEDISDSLISACELYRLRAVYRFNGEITSKFVQVYNKSRTKRWFKNLHRLYNYKTIEISLEKIRQDEALRYSYAMNSTVEAQNSDINSKYVYDQHRIALMLLRICGWNNLDDEKYITNISLYQNLIEGEKTILFELDMIYHYFTGHNLRRLNLTNLNIIKKDHDKYIECVLTLINRVLFIMYGACIRGCKNASEMYEIIKCNLFTRNINDFTKPFYGAYEPHDGPDKITVIE
jgi:hypothetical protein